MSDNELESMVRERVKEFSLQLAPYKRPANIIVKREGLPKTTTRKVKRQEVKKMLAEV